MSLQPALGQLGTYFVGQEGQYLLSLELNDRGFHHTVLSEFRTRLLTHQAEGRLFETVLGLAQGRGLLHAGGRQRSDATHVLGAVRMLTRLEVVTETVRQAGLTLASEAPDWLRAYTTSAAVERDEARAREYRLPKSQTKRLTWAMQVGADGMALLAALYADTAFPMLRAWPAVQTLRQVWIQNFLVCDEPLVWRDHDNLPPAGRYSSSPYDTAVRYATKRTTAWTGDKVHLTETCDDERPHLITNVETTPATVADDAVTAAMHAALAARSLLPSQHIADTGFVNSALFVSRRRDYALDRIGPTRADNQGQAKQQAGFAAADFTMDWAQHQAICPLGKRSNSWTPAIDKFKNHVIKIKFATTDGQQCPCQTQSTHATPPRRAITVRPQAQHEALLDGRQRGRTALFTTTYAVRAGIEGTIAQGTRSCDLRRSRSVGQARTHLQQLMTATTINVVRLLRWLAGEPKAATRPNGLAQLYQPSP